MLILNLPPCFPHRIAEWKSAPNSKQTFIWSPSIRSYIILALGIAIVFVFNLHILKIFYMQQDWNLKPGRILLMTVYVHSRCLTYPFVYLKPSLVIVSYAKKPKWLDREPVGRNIQRTWGKEKRNCPYIRLGPKFLKNISKSY